MTATDDEIGKRRYGRLWSFTDRSAASATVPSLQPDIDAYLQSREHDLAQMILRALEHVEIAAPRS